MAVGGDFVGRGINVAGLAGGGGGLWEGINVMLMSDSDGGSVWLTSMSLMGIVDSLEGLGSRFGEENGEVPSSTD